ncbi:MAG: two-component regulator propeller domain-containing protein [Bacteroidia bacterium]
MNYGRLRSLLAVLLLLSGGQYLIAQASDLSFRIRTFSREQGLSQSQVNCMVQDARGFIWMGTKGGGLSRFDGQTFFTFNEDQGLPGNDIEAAAIDGSGKLWLACEQHGLISFDGHTFQVYGKALGVPTDRFNHIFASADGSIWIGTLGKGLYRWDGKRAKRILRSDSIPLDTAHAFLPISEDKMWVATSRGIVQVNAGIATPLDSARYPNAPRKEVECMTRLADGTIMGGNTNGQVWRLISGRFVNDTLPESIGVIKDIFQDKTGQIWLAGSELLACMSQNGFRKFTSEDGLKDVTVECLLGDQNGNIWAGSNGAGAFKFSKEAFSIYGVKTPFANRAVFAIEQIGPGHLMVGTERGLYEVQDGLVQELKIPGIPSPYILSIAKADDGSMYIAAQSDGCFRYADGKFEHVTVPATGKPFRTSYLGVTNEGKVMGIDANGVLSAVNGLSAAPMAVPDLHLEEEGFAQTFGGQDSVCYLGSETNGIIRLHKGEVKRFQAPDILINNHVVSALEDHNRAFWVGTYEGLTCIRGNEPCYLTVEEGLAGNLIYCLVEDKKGNLWVGTDFGVTKIELGANSEVLAMRSYGSEDGFIGLECNQAAAYCDDQGLVWFGTIEGLACYHPDRDFQDPNPPMVQIMNVQLELQQVDWAARKVKTEAWSGVPINPVFEPDENHIRIEFTGVTHRLPEKIQYRYRLLGLNEDFSSPSRENHAVYPYLPSGEYTFELIAGNAAGVWTKEPVKFHFVIRTPFYLTTWFGILSFLLVIGTMVVLGRLRISRLERQRKNLETKVKQRTEALEQANQVKGEFLAKMSHEIRTPMNGVIGMTDLLERTQLTPQQRKFVENIRVSGQNLLSLINDILDFSRIESGKMELEHIPFEMRHLIEEVMDILAFGAFSKGLEMLYWVDPEIRGPMLGDPARMKQILTNLIGNAIKFTAKGEITVRVSLQKVDGEKATIQVCVKDSGIGIPKEKHNSLFESFTQVDASTTRKYGGTGLGLAISFNLAKMMGGRMWLESEPGNGTEFYFTFEAGMSEPWKFPGQAHPARALEGKKVVLAMQHQPTVQLISDYLEHWKVNLQVHDSLESATDAALDQTDVEFLIVDLRLSHGGPNQFAKRIAAACAHRKLNFALYAEPDIAIILQNDVGPNGWVLSRPLKRDDLLQALMGQRVSNVAASNNDQTQAFAMQHPLSILVAEDNPINQDVANGMLNSLGYTVRNASNGQEAVEYVMENQVDVIFMDVQMPVMDGLEATRLIVGKMPKAERPVIVAMTANAMESDRQRCLDAGMDTYISKPFLMTELMNVLRAVPALRAGQADALEQLTATGPDTQQPSPETKAPSAKYRLTSMDMLDAVSGGEPAFVIGILTKLVVKLPEAIEELRTALQTEDWETIRATSHRTKSSAAYSGSEELKEKFRELEHMTREKKDLDQVPEKLDALEAFVKEVVEELKGHLAERT